MQARCCKLFGKSMRVVAIALLAVPMMPFASLPHVAADCTSTGTVHTCDTDVPNPDTAQSLLYGGSDLTRIETSPGAQIVDATVGANEAGLLADTNSPGNLEVVLGDDTLIDVSAISQGYKYGVLVRADEVGDVSLTNLGATIVTSNSTSTASRLSPLAIIRTADGDNNVSMSAGSLTAGTAAVPSNNTHGIELNHYGHEGNTTVDFSGGSIAVAGVYSHGIQVFYHNGSTGTSELTMSGGEIDTGIGGSRWGNGLRVDYRIDSVGDATANLSGGTIETFGVNDSQGIAVFHGGVSGSANINQTGGTIVTHGNYSYGIFAERYNGSNLPLADDLNVAITRSGGQITTMADNAPGSYGRTLDVYVDSEVRIEQSGGSITTSGAESFGTWARMEESVNVLGQNDADSIVNLSGGSTLTTGDDSHALYSSMAKPTGMASVSTGSQLVAQGADSDGVRVDTSAFGNIYAIEVSGGLVSGGTGSAAGISATSGGGGTIDISGGVVTALTDRAISVAGGSVAITNDGTVIGYLDLGDNADSFLNTSATSLDLRSFVDTDANLVRDTENVAVSDFGAGNDSFENASGAVVRLLSVEDLVGFTAATDDDVAPVAWNASGPAEYFPGGSAAVANTTSGVEQAHLVQLETFTNSGIITLADTETGGTAPVAGSTLVITASTSAGVENGGSFVSNGGELHLDTVLDNGVSDTTDALVIDNATTGSGGPTMLTINNAGGSGALTGHSATDGILVVQVLGASSDDAFALTAPVQIGGFLYELVQADGQSWYLQSALTSIVLDSTTVPENSPANTSVGSLSVTDGDPSDNYIYSLTCQTPGVDDDLFQVVGASVIAVGTFDFENAVDANTDGVYEVCVQATDGAGLTHDQLLQITVGDLDNAPTDISLGGTHHVDDMSAAGTLVGLLSTTDDGEDNVESYTYSVTCTTAGANDSTFQIVGNDLRLATTVSHIEGQSNFYEVCIRVTETNGGLTYDKVFIVIVDEAEVLSELAFTGPNSTSISLLFVGSSAMLLGLLMLFAVRRRDDFS